MSDQREANLLGAILFSAGVASNDGIFVNVCDCTRRVFVVLRRQAAGRLETDERTSFVCGGITFRWNEHETIRLSLFGWALRSLE